MILQSYCQIQSFLWLKIKLYTESEYAVLTARTVHLFILMKGASNFGGDCIHNIITVW